MTKTETQFKTAVPRKSACYEAHNSDGRRL